MAGPSYRSTSRRSLRAAAARPRSEVKTRASSVRASARYAASYATSQRRDRLDVEMLGNIDLGSDRKLAVGSRRRAALLKAGRLGPPPPPYERAECRSFPESRRADSNHGPLHYEGMIETGLGQLAGIRSGSSRLNRVGSAVLGTGMGTRSPDLVGARTPRNLRGSARVTWRRRRRCARASECQDEDAGAHGDPRSLHSGRCRGR